MGDASQFGGQLDAGTQFGASQFGGQLDAGTQFGASFGADAPEAPDAPAQEVPDARPAAAKPGIFGSALRFGTGYTPPKPDADPLDAAGDLIQQQIARKTQVGTDPLAQFFQPEVAAKAREEVPALTQQLQQIRQQKAQQAEIQKVGANYGINNLPVGADRATAINTMTDELQQRYLNGDPMAAHGLVQLGRADLVQGGQEQALSAATVTNQRYQTAVDQLSNARSPDEYDIVRRKLEQETKDGKHQDHELASVPPTFEAFQKAKSAISNSLSQQRMAIDARKAQMQQLGGVTPIQKQTDKDGNAIGIHATVQGQVRDNNGVPLGGVEPVTVGGVYNGNRLPYGSSDINAVGDKWGTMDKAEVKDTRAAVEPHKATVERAAGINKLNDIAQQPDFGSNAWLLGHGIDQFVEISRNGVGGKGSATPGTIHIMENLRGQLQTASDRVQKEWGRVSEWLDGGKKGTMPYLSPETISALQSAIKTLKAGSDDEIKGSVGAIARDVGRRGGKLDDMGFQPGVADAVKQYWQEGNQALKQDLARRPAIVMQGQRIVFDPSGPVPPSAQAPGGFDKPVQSGTAGSAGPSPPAVPPPPNQSPQAPASPTGSGGGGSPVQIAGATVNVRLPPGASPNFVSNLQRVESGNEANPWRSGAGGLSSASGAFQAITSTWNQFKPPGAPARAAEATAQQQADFLSNYTAANATDLKRNGLPVNDTTLYIAHNLGTGGANAFLHADPNADARKVVGEKAASNNPLFFKGNPTVAEAMARYQAHMSGGQTQPQAPAAPGPTTDPRDAFATRVQPQPMAPSGPRDPNAPAPGSPGAPQVPISEATIDPNGAPVNPGSRASEQRQSEGVKNGIELAPALIPGGGLAAGAARVAASGGASAVVKALEGGSNSDITLAAAGGAAGGLLGEGIGRLIGRALRGNAAREVGAAAEILADPNATAATRQQAMQVARHYDLTEHQLVAMRDAVQAGASKAEAAMPGGAASDATASARIAPAIQQEHQAATHGYGVIEDALAAAPNAAGVKTKAVQAVTAGGMDADPAVMTAAKRLDSITANASGRNPIQQYEAIRNVTSDIKAAARRTDGITARGLGELAQAGDRVKEMHVVSALGTPEGPRMINYARGSDAMWRDLKTTVQDSDMLSAIGRGDERTSLGRALLNVVKIGHAGEDAALNAVTSLRRITANAPEQLRAAQELYMREAFAGARAKSDIQAAGREILNGKSSSVARALLTPEQLAAVRRTVENAGQYATRGKGEVGFESALMAGDAAREVGHVVPGAGMLSSAFNLVQLRGNVRMFLRSLPAGYKDIVARPNAPAAVGAAAGGAVGGQLAGARKAPDGNTYVPDPQRPGKYLRVKQ